MDSLLVILAVITFPLFFVGIWCLVCSILSFVSGWHGLSRKYAAQAPPLGHHALMASGRIGLVNYNNCLQVHSNEEGVFLSVWPIFRIFHKTLFLPYSHLHQIREYQILWQKMVKFEIGNPKLASISLSAPAFNSFASQLKKSRE